MVRIGPPGGPSPVQQRAFDEFYLQKFAVKILPLNLAAYALTIEIFVLVRWLTGTVHRPVLAWVGVFAGIGLMLLAWLCHLFAIRGQLYRTTFTVLVFAGIGAGLGWRSVAIDGTGVLAFMPVAMLMFVVGALFAPRYWILQLGIVIILVPMFRLVPYDNPPVPHQTRLLIQFVVGGFTTTSLFYLLVRRVKWSYFTLLEEATALAQRDALTGLHNRQAWTELSLAWLTAAPAAAHPCVIYLDVDQFKRFNDRYGHQIGDAVLQRVARAIERAFPAAIAARFGGDEFVLLLPTGCVAVAEVGLTRLRESLAAPDGTVEPVTVSAGIAVHNGRETLAETIHRADLELVRAKQDRPADLIPV